MPNLNRRDFLKALGVGSATSTLAACGIDTNNYKTPVELVLPYVVKPDQVTPGTPTFFATTVLRGPYARPVAARHRDGRVVFVSANRYAEGRPGVGSHDYFELQRHYSPDRIKAPIDGGAETTWDAALPKLADAVKAAKAAGQKVVYLGGYKSGAIVDLLRDFTGGEAIFWEPAGYENEIEAAQAVFGRRVLPFYGLDQAQYVLSFGAPFLSGNWGDAEIEARWSKARNPNEGHFVARFALVAPYRDQTGASADDWFACTPGTEVQVAKAIASLAAERAGATQVSALLGTVDVTSIATAAGIEPEALKSIAENLVSSRGLVLPGGASSSADLAAVTYLINLAIGAAPSRFHLGGYAGPVDGIARITQLVADLEAGTVGVLLVDDANPVYALPDASGFAAAAKKAGLVVGLSSHPDETQALASLVLPTSDAFEDWGDEAPIAGLRTLRQPSMTPLNDTRSLGDVLLTTARAAGLGVATAALAAPAAAGATTTATAAPTPAPTTGGLGFGPATWREYVATTWQGGAWDGTGTFVDFWEGSLVRGFDWKQPEPTTITPALTTSALSFATPTAPAAGEIVLLSYPHPHRGDGRYANEPWAQEIPDPLHGITWDSWLEVSEALAEKHGLTWWATEAQVVELQAPTGDPIRLPAIVSRGVKGDTVVLAFGQGHTAMGRYANGYGVNAAKLYATPVTGGGWAPVKVSLKPTGEKIKLASTFSYYEKTDRDRHFGVHVDAEKLAAVGDAPAERPGELTGIHEVELDKRLEDIQVGGFYDTPEHPTYRFGMTVDTNSCTGCWSCSIACYAENNLPVVGKDQITRGREMQWLRINRYWQDDVGGQDDIQFVPMMCQHCGHAGCESVCPVLATYHNIDGLNAMVYNRCVGTRYCSNACPYSVRRFNYYTFAWPEPFNLQLNPDVTVRQMGVMEKCTFCVQRLRSVKSAWKDHNGFTATVPDEQWRNVPACVEACPTGALTFGNLKEDDGHCSQTRKSARNYQPLADLRTLSAVNYLAKASFHHDPTVGHHGGGHENAEHGAAPADGGHEATPAAHEEG